MKRKKSSKSISIDRIRSFEKNGIWLADSNVNCRFCHKNINVTSNNRFDVTKIKKHINKKIHCDNEIKMKNQTNLESLFKDSMKKEEDFQKDLSLMIKYLPLVTVEVERSFSAYRQILSEYRESLSEINLKSLLIVYFNRNKN